MKLFFSLLLVAGILLASINSGSSSHTLPATAAAVPQTACGDSMLTTEILSAQPWQVFEERGVHGGDLLYYIRGGKENTESFDQEYVIFNSDGTGLLSSNEGGRFKFKWQFENPEHTKLTWKLLKTPATYTITWDNMRYHDGFLRHDQYFTDGNTGLNGHSQQIRMPMDEGSGAPKVDPSKL